MSQEQDKLLIEVKVDGTTNTEYVDFNHVVRINSISAGGRDAPQLHFSDGTTVTLEGLYTDFILLLRKNPLFRTKVLTISAVTATAT